MRILGFILEVVFQLLVGAALLRAYMNGLRVNMQVQPGIFVMAVTDWIVKPLRRWLPQAVVRARLDWASVLASVLLALAYAVLWGSLIGMVYGGAAISVAGPGLLGLALTFFLRVALQTLSLLVLAYVLVSWLQAGSFLHSMLARLVEPVLSPFRRLVPVIGGIDLSPMVLLLVLQVGVMLLG
jgi:YggT family protein